MSLVVRCACGRQFPFTQLQIGKKGRCPQCGALVLLQPEGGPPPAPAGDKTAPAADKNKAPADKGVSTPKGGAPPAAPKGGAAPVSQPGAPAKGPAPAKAPAPAAAAGKPKISVDDLVELRAGALRVSTSGEPDATSQLAGIRHTVQRFCPTCGTRYNEGAARCSNCHAPLSKEEIAAAEAAKRPPLLPWLPRLYLSGRAKVVVGLLIVAVIGALVYACMYPSLRRRGRLRAELTLVERALTTKTLTATDSLVTLILDMPGYPWRRPATVKALGKWERRAGAAVFDTYGTGTYDLAKRELVLTAAKEGFQYRAVAPPVLHLAARAGDISLVRRLLNEPGCNVNQTDAKGATALHAAAAARGDQVELVRLLLARGASDSMTDEKGLTAQAVARAHKNPRVVKALGGGPALEPAF